MSWRRWYERQGRGLPTWAARAPHRTAYLSTESGVWAPVLHDLRTGERRRVDTELGAARGVLASDGSGLAWFRDDDGSEHGEFLFTPFASPTRPLVPSLGRGRGTGLAVGGDAIAASLQDGAGYALAVSGGVILREAGPLAVHGVSGDGSVVSLRPTAGTTRLIDAETGETRVVEGSAERWDARPGSARLLLREAAHQRWILRDVMCGESREVLIPDGSAVADWCGDEVLVAIRAGGGARLVRIDLTTGRHEPLDLPQGTVHEARLRPDGRVWMSFSSGALPRHVRSTDPHDTELARIVGAPPDPGAALRALSYDNGEGGAVGAFLATPDRPGPHPTVVLLHGGPHAEARDAWDPAVQAWIDAGFAVFQPNFRGSTGREDAWRTAIEGDPGRPELVDIAAGVAHLVDTGIADPARLIVAGASWGGYLALLCAGRLPHLWAAVIADRPLADPARAHASASPEIRAFDRRIFAGSPDQAPALWAERSPRACAHRITAPVLITATEHDARCPLDQIETYVADLAWHGIGHEFAIDHGGHTTRSVAGAIALQARALAFATRHITKENP